jgi:tetratricopeptide (TPR) repeat protein
MTPPRRTLCGAVDIKGWSGRPVPEQIRAQQSLVTVVRCACREAGLPEEIVQNSGDGVLIMPPGDIDESTAIPDLVRGMTTALRQENRLLSEAARIRLRLALSSGMVATGPTGFSGPAIIECFRLLDSPPARAALTDFAQAELAVIVSDYLYRDVIQHGFRDLRAEDFWSVRSTLPEKSFTANAWVWVSDRTGGSPPEVATPAEETPARPPGLPDEITKARLALDEGRPREALALLDAIAPTSGVERSALLDVKAACLISLGEHRRAVADLEEILRLEPIPSPATLLRLGRAHLQLGNVQVARHTFRYLIDRAPMEPEAYLELGRLERQAGRGAAAKGCLAEAARLLPANGLLAVLVDELLELPIADVDTDNG